MDVSCVSPYATLLLIIQVIFIIYSRLLRLSLGRECFNMPGVFDGEGAMEAHRQVEQIPSAPFAPPQQLPPTGEEGESTAGEGASREGASGEGATSQGGGRM